MSVKKKKNYLFHFEELHENPGYLLWQIAMLWQRRMKNGLDTLAITHTQFVILAALKWLRQSQEAVTQADVANHANIDRMMTSKIVKGLLAKGILRAMPHKSDSRSHTLHFTDKGEKLFRSALEIVQKIDASFFSLENPSVSKPIVAALNKIIKMNDEHISCND